MKRIRYSYSSTAIVADWRADKSTGYAVRLAKKYKVPTHVIHNVIYQHRKKKAKLDANYRAKKEGRPVPNQSKPKRKKAINVGQSIFRNHVVIASAMTNFNKSFIIV
jgi:hypothetical protein